MRYLKLSRRATLAAWLLVGLLFYSRVSPITVILTPATQHVVAKMWPAFSYNDDDEDGDDDDGGDDGYDDDGDD